MSGNNGLWLAFPQQKGEQDGETKWFDQMFLTKPEAEHVRRLVIADLQAQGHLEAPARGQRGSGQQADTPDTRGRGCFRVLPKSYRR